MTSAVSAGTEHLTLAGTKILDVEAAALSTNETPAHPGASASASGLATGLAAGSAAAKPVIAAEAEVASRVVSAEAAARRALCLCALLRRGELEAVLQGLAENSKPAGHIDPAAATTQVRQINEWLKDDGLWLAASDKEKEAFNAAPGTWTCRALVQVAWRTEALGVIGWALGLEEEILPYDVQWGGAPLTHSLRILSPVEAFVSSARLGAEGQILQAREIAEAWLWRARTTPLQKHPGEAPFPPSLSVPETVAATAAYWQKHGLFKAVKRDFPARGKTYAELAESERRELQSIATERLYGLNWLCRRAENWDLVPTAT